MVKNKLIFLLSSMTLLGFHVPQNQMADDLLNALTDEQKVSTYTLAKSIGNLSDVSKIELIFNDGSSRNYKVGYLIDSFKPIAKDAESSDKSDKLAEHIKFRTRLKIKEIKEIKLFILDKNGEKIIKFESAGLKIGKRKIGPFEIPSNKILIVSPRITYYRSTL